MRDPKQLREGYEASLEQQKTTRARQMSHLTNLRKKLIKLDRSRETLNSAYIDPDIRLTKSEYISQKNRLDTEIEHLHDEIDIVEKALADVPTPAELETLEAFAAEINERLDTINPSKEEKRKIIELLHVKVILELDGELKLEGWFLPLEYSVSYDEELSEGDGSNVTDNGLLGQQLSLSVQKPVSFSITLADILFSKVIVKIVV